MCRHCELNETCKKDDSYPMISALSNYALRWYNEFQAGFSQYPDGGTWQTQPMYFDALMQTIRGTIHRMETDERNLERMRNAR